GAMMAGADRDMLLVQYGADVVRMNPLDREADDAGRILGAEQAHRIEAAQGVARLADQGGLVGADRAEADAVDIVDRRVQADNADDVRSPRLEPGRGRGVGGAMEGHPVDHRSGARRVRLRLEDPGARALHNE